MHLLKDVPSGGLILAACELIAEGVLLHSSDAVEEEQRDVVVYPIVSLMEGSRDDECEHGRCKCGQKNESQSYLIGDSDLVRTCGRTKLVQSSPGDREQDSVYGENEYGSATCSPPRAILPERTHQ